MDAAARAGLAEGRELDRPLARRLAQELRRSEALRIAGRALRDRDRSAAELERRLTRRAIPAAARAEALDALVRVGAVDDERLALRRAEALAERGYGDAAVRADLERRGISPQAARAALAALAPERERLERLVARRGAGPGTARFLAGRGFDPDAVADAVGPLVAGED